MKLSTKILIGLVAAILAGTFLAPAILLAPADKEADNRVVVNVTAGDSIITTPLERVETFNVMTNGLYYIDDNRDSLTVEFIENPNISTPTISINANWKPYLEVSLDSANVEYDLKIAFDTDSINSITVDPKMFKIATVNVPKGMIKEIYSREINLVAMGFTTPITAKGDISIIP